MRSLALKKQKRVCCVGSVWALHGSQGRKCGQIRLSSMAIWQLIFGLNTSCWQLHVAFLLSKAGCVSLEFFAPMEIHQASDGNTRLRVGLRWQMEVPAWQLDMPPAHNDQRVPFERNTEPRESAQNRLPAPRNLRFHVSESLAAKQIDLLTGSGFPIFGFNI